MIRADAPEPATGTTARQQAIYRTGLAGRKPTLPVQASALEAAAARRLSSRAHAYIAGGAGDEQTLAAEFDLSLALTGARTVADLDAGHIAGAANA